MSQPDPPTQGLQGVQGNQGEQGVQGQTGTPGAPGMGGSRGKTGETGEAGTTTIVRERSNPWLRAFIVACVLFACAAAYGGVKLVDQSVKLSDQATKTRNLANANTLLIQQEKADQVLSTNEIRTLACIIISQTPNSKATPLIDQYRAFYKCPPYSAARAKNPFLPLPVVPTVPPPNTVPSTPAPTPRPSQTTARPVPTRTVTRVVTLTPRPIVSVPLPLPLPTVCIVNTVCI